MNIKNILHFVLINVISFSLYGMHSNGRLALPVDPAVAAAQRAVVSQNNAECKRVSADQALHDTGLFEPLQKLIREYANDWFEVFAAVTKRVTIDERSSCSVILPDNKVALLLLYSIKIVDIETGSAIDIAMRKGTHRLFSMPHGELLAVVMMHNNKRFLVIYDSATGKLKYSLEEDAFHNSVPHSALEITPEGVIIIGYEDGFLQKWHPQKGLLETLSDQKDIIAKMPNLYRPYYQKTFSIPCTHQVDCVRAFGGVELVAKDRGVELHDGRSVPLAVLEAFDMRFITGNESVLIAEGHSSVHLFKVQKDDILKNLGTFSLERFAQIKKHIKKIKALVERSLELNLLAFILVHDSNIGDLLRKGQS
jgi:hypothetical protein